MCGLSARLVRNCSAFSLLVASALLSILWTGELGPMGLLSGVELNPEQSTASVFHGPVQPQPCPNHSMPVCSPCAEKNLSDAVGSEGPAQYRQENNRTVERHGDGPGSNDTEVHSRDWFSEFSDFAFAVITGRQKQQVCGVYVVCVCVCVCVWHVSLVVACVRWGHEFRCVARFCERVCGCVFSVHVCAE